MFSVKHKALLIMILFFFSYLCSDLNVRVKYACRVLYAHCTELHIMMSPPHLSSPSRNPFSLVPSHLSLSLYLPLSASLCSTLFIPSPSDPSPSCLPLHLSLYLFTCSHQCITLCPLQTLCISCSFTSSSHPFVRLLCISWRSTSVHSPDLFSLFSS